jgi:hypothetical protein
MGVKGFAIVAAWMALALAPFSVSAAPPQQAPTTTATPAAVPQSSAIPAAESESIRDYQPQPHITAINPPTVVPVWTLHEQILWAANLVLAFLGYGGIVMAVSLLKKIARQMAYAEAAADAATASAQAALLHSQAVVKAERPWILVTVEPSRSMENSFTIMATNRGRTPARIIETKENSRITINEKRLPQVPEYKHEERSTPFNPIILLPGESTLIKPFSREDVKALCDSEERFKRIETWEEKAYLYGQVQYRDLIAPSEGEVHETNWCCWYIHGRQNSGLVISGPHAYNSHT